MSVAIARTAEETTRDAVERIARELYPECWEGRYSEGLDLLQVASQMKTVVLASHLIDWKRGRGPISTLEMETPGKRNRWVRFAFQILKLRPSNHVPGHQDIRIMEVIRDLNGYPYLNPEEKVVMINMVIRFLETIKAELV
jgi:hypothetical protein